jgi:site-specific recombinase XerD
LRQSMICRKNGDGMEEAGAGKAEALLRRYAHSLEMANYSPRTIREYGKIVRQWIRVSGNGTLRVGPEELDAWVAAMYGRGLQPGTIANRITVLRAFFSWAVEEGAIESNPAAALPKVRLGRRLPKAMTRAEVRQFMAAVLAEGGTHAQRDHVLFTLMYTCGLRISEVVGLRVEDFDPEWGIL